MSISIKQGTWRKISAEDCRGEYVLIEGIGAGLGILVYDPDSCDTFGGHFVSPNAHSSYDFFALLQQSMEDFRDSARVFIHVTGCVEQDGEEWGSSPEGAKRIPGIVARLGQY